MWGKIQKVLFCVIIMMLFISGLFMGAVGPINGNSKIYFSDVNNDLKLDLIFAGIGFIKVYLNTGAPGSPQFTGEPIDIPLAIEDFQRLCATFVDVDNDGDMDIFFGTQRGTVGWVRNSGNAGNPQWLESDIVYSGQWQTSSFQNILAESEIVMLSFIDFDGDGDVDFNYSDLNGNIVYYLNLDHDPGDPDSWVDGTEDEWDGLLPWEDSPPTSTSGVLPVVHWLDWEGDGDFDFLVGHQFPGAYFNRNNGSPTVFTNFSFVSAFEFDELMDGSFFSLYLEDFTNNGYLDLYYTSNEGNLSFHEMVTANDLDPDITPPNTDIYDLVVDEISMNTIILTWPVAFDPNVSGDYRSGIKYYALYRSTTGPDFTPNDDVNLLWKHYQLPHFPDYVPEFGGAESDGFKIVNDAKGYNYYYKDAALPGGYTYYYKLRVVDYAGNNVLTEAAEQELAEPYLDSVDVFLTPAVSDDNFELTITTRDQYGMTFSISPNGAAPNVSVQVDPTPHVLYDTESETNLTAFILDGFQATFNAVTIQGVDCLEDFTVQVQATHYVDDVPAGNASGTSNLATLDTQQPPQPTGLYAPPPYITGESITLTWNSVSDSCTSVAYYNVWAKSESQAEFQVVGTPNSTGFVHDNLDQGTTYYYYVIAVDDAGNESLPSTIINAQTLADDDPPTVPTDVTAVYNAEHTQIAVTWSPSSDESGIGKYEIYKRESLGDFPEYYAQVDGSTTTFNDYVSYPGHPLYYSIKAWDTYDNASVLSEEAVADIGGDEDPPTRPTSLTATALGPTSIGLTWSASYDSGTGVSFYRIYRDGSATVLGTSTSTSYTDMGLTPNTTYSYKVSAVDGAGNESTKSIADSATTEANFDPPNPPRNLGFMAKTATSITLQWDPPIDNGVVVARYFIYQHTSAEDPTGSRIATSLGSPQYIDGFEPNTTYYFTVSAESDAFVESDRSNLLTVATSVLKPSKPANLTAVASYNNWVDLAWNSSDMPGDLVLDYYRVYEVVGNPFGPVYYTLGETTTTTFHVADWADTSKKYAVRAYATNGTYSEYSNTLEVSENIIDETPPPIPQNLSGYASDPFTILISWDPVTDTKESSGLAGYEIYRDSQLLAFTEDADYTDQDLTPLTMYTYAVLAKDNAGNKSAQSESVDVSTPVHDVTPPPAPTDLVGQALDHATIELVWSPVEDEIGGSGLAGYIVYRGEVSIGVTENPTFTDTGLDPETTYTYKVKAQDNAGNPSEFSDPEDVTTPAEDVTLPPVPTNLEGEATDAFTVELTWSPVEDEEGGSGLAGYEVFRDTFLISTTVDPVFTDTGLDPETTYTYAVKAYDNANNRSDFSDSVDVTTPMDDETPPPAPTNLEGEATDAFTVELSWSPVEDEEGGSGLAGYEVFRDTFLISATVDPVFTDTGLDPETTYTYAVKAYDNVGNRSDFSDSIDVTTPVDDQTPPPAPTGLEAEAFDDSVIQLSWEPVEDEGGSGLAGYEVYRDDVLIDTSVDPNYTDAGLDPETSYTYAVKAFDNAGNASDFSDPVTESTFGMPLLCAQVASDTIWMTQFSVINVGMEDNPVFFYAYSSSGDLVEEVELATLPPNSCLCVSADDIFSPETFAEDIWVKITSRSTLKGVLAFGTRDAETFVTIPMFSRGADDLCFPYVVYVQDFWYTGISLINPDVEDVSAELKAIDEKGFELASTNQIIPPRGKYIRTVDNIFDGVDPTTIRFIQVASTRPLIGFELFSSLQDLGLSGLPAFSLTTDLFGHPSREKTGSPDGPLSDPSTPTGFHGTAITDSEIYLAWNSVPEPGVEYVIYEYSMIAPTELTSTTDTHYTVTGLEPDTAYPLFVRAREISSGDESASTGIITFWTLAEGESNYPYQLFYNEVPDPSNYFIGITFTNMGEDEATVYLEMYDEDGNRVAGPVMRDVDPLEQMTRSLADFFGDPLPAGSAYIKAGSFEKLMGFELFHSGGGQAPHHFQFDGIIGVEYGAATLYFPMVKTGTDKETGAQWESIFSLTDLSKRNNNVAVYAYNCDGNQLDIFTHLLEPKEKMSMLLDDMFPTTIEQIVWIKVETDGEVIGDLMYQDSFLTRISAYMGILGLDD